MTETLTMAEDTVQLCTFVLNEKIFAVNITDVKEVDADTNFTPVFHSIEAISGYLNIRGRIYLIVDMRRLLGFEAKEPDRLSRVILFQQKMGESFGILVDQIGDVLTVEKDKIEEVNDVGSSQLGSDKEVGGHLSKGIYKLEDSLLVILKTENILMSVEN